MRVGPKIAAWLGMLTLAAGLGMAASAILLDGTTAENAPLIECSIAAVRVPLRSVKQLISDHAHNDHVGALARIKRDSGLRNRLGSRPLSPRIPAPWPHP